MSVRLKLKEEYPGLMLKIPLRFRNWIKSSVSPQSSVSERFEVRL